jgi:pimeloyl-ACP methyl ester carboxylesterase
VAHIRSWASRPPVPLAGAGHRHPEARLVVFDRSGHYPFIEEPDTFWATVATFLTPPADIDTSWSAPSN